MRIKTLLLFVLFLATGIPAAVAGEFMFRHLEVKDGLSNNQINGIFKDSDGFMWFATASGLNRYDGYRIRMFHNSDMHIESLPDNYIIDLQEDDRKRLWIRTDSGYIIYDPATDTFTNDLGPLLRAAGIEESPSAIYIDSNKHFWLFAPSQGCCVYAPETGARHALPTSNEGLLSEKITDIKECAEGILVIYENGTFLCLDKTDCRLKWKVDDITVKQPKENEVFTLFADCDNDIWIYSPSNLWVYSTKRKEWHSQLCNLVKRGLHNMVRTVAQDAQGCIWIGKDQDGIDVLDKQAGTIRHLSNHPDDPRSLQNNTITSLYLDAEGIMWVGTFKKGISYYSENLFKFGIEHVGDINCIEEDRDGYVWLGTNNAGLIRWNKTTGDRQPFVHGGKGTLPSNAVVCMLKASDGRLWLGTFWGGLSCYANGHFSQYRHTPGDTTSLCHDNVWALAEDKQGNIWLGTLGGGVQCLDPRTGQFTTFNVHTAGIHSDYVQSICLSRDDVLLIGTAYGLSTLDLKTHRVTNLKGNRSGTEHFTNLNINQVYEDSRGLIWIGTRDGLNVYDPLADRLLPLPIELGNTSRFISGITEDNNKSMWITTSNGIVNIVPSTEYRTNEYTFRTYAYNDKDGLQNCEFNQRSIKRLSSDEIWIGGLYGINYFRPEHIKYNKALPKVMFTRLALFNEEVETGKAYNGRVILGTSLNRGRQVELDYRQNVFSIEFATDDYILPEQTQYTYQLQGFNNDWLTTTTGKITYTNLAPGSYVLRVKAINSDGYHSDEEARLKITVHPPFWRSVWAYLLYAILFAALLLAARWHLLRNERNKFKLQQIEQEARKNQEINEMKLRFFTNISHDLRTPLTLILSPLESLIKEHEKDAELADKLKMMQRNATRLLNMVNQLLDFRKSDVSGHHLSLSDGDIIVYLRNICHSFASLSEKKAVHLTFFSALPSLNMAFDADKIGKIIMNLLSNAFKFTPEGGRVDVALDVIKGTNGQKTLEIKVADTGIGIREEDKAHIFERFYQAEHPNIRTSGSGVGLNIVRDFVTLHGGNILVLDNVPAGSIFVVQIPANTTQQQADAPAPDGTTVLARETLSPQQEEIPMAETTPTEGKDLPEGASPHSKDNRPLIMVVDDNEDFRTFMQSSLQKEYRVVLAADGQEAWEQILQQRPDLIVCDVMMPVMDGNELCRLVKADKRTTSIPFVLLTAHQSTEHKLEGLTLGADDYISKPFNMDILTLRMRKLLSLKKAADARNRSRIDPEPSDIVITSMDEKLIARAVKYVEENLTRSDLSVEELSRELGMSRVHLYKKLLAITGKTPIEFIRLIRIKRAAQLLRESQQNVSEIAYQVGFNNPKYFTKYFKEEYGMLPSTYQEKEGK